MEFDYSRDVSRQALQGLAVPRVDIEMDEQKIQLVCQDLT